MREREREREEIRYWREYYLGVCDLAWSGLELDGGDWKLEFWGRSEEARGATQHNRHYRVLA